MLVAVIVARGSPVLVGLGTLTSGVAGMEAMAVSVAAIFADSAVCAMIVGRSSGGIGVGIEFVAGGAHPASSPSREARIKYLRFI
jgi:hypothetical protein